MLVTIMIFTILIFVWVFFGILAMHNTLVEIKKNTAMPSVMNVSNGPGSDQRG